MPVFIQRHATVCGTDCRRLLAEFSRASAARLTEGLRKHRRIWMGAAKKVLGHRRTYSLDPQGRIEQVCALTGFRKISAETRNALLSQEGSAARQGRARGGSTVKPYRDAVLEPQPALP